VQILREEHAGQVPKQACPAVDHLQQLCERQTTSLLQITFFPSPTSHRIECQEHGPASLPVIQDRAHTVKGKRNEQIHKRAKGCENTEQRLTNIQKK
jgi:hypothetical protein